MPAAAPAPSAPAPPPPKPSAAPGAPAAAPKPGAAPPARPSSGPPETSDEGKGWLEEAGDELIALDEKENQVRPVKTERPKPKVDDDGTGELEETPKPGEQPKPGATETTPPEPERPLKAPELRKAYEESKKKIEQELTPKITKLEARIKELEAADPAQVGPMAEQIKSIKARNDDLERHIQLLDFSKSEKYQKEYFQPYVKAWDKCLADLAGLEVEMPNGETRKPTEADIQRLATLPLGELIKQSNAMFGDAGDVIRGHVREIVRLNEAQTEALANAAKNAEEFAKNNQTKTFEEQKQRHQLWKDVNDQLREKFPKFFAPIEGDVEGNKLLDQGFALTNIIFSTGKLTPEEIALLPNTFRRDIETKGQLSPENTVRLHALIRNKAANHDRLARRVKALQAQLAEKDKALAEYEDSEPPLGGGRVGKGTGVLESWDADANAEIDELDRKGR